MCRAYAAPGPAPFARSPGSCDELVWMRVMFAIYLVLIVAGIVFYAVVGLTHH